MLGNPLLLGDDGYQISRSVRLRSSASAYLRRTPSSTGNRQRFTWSGWCKRGTLGAVGNLFSVRNSNETNLLRFNSNDTILLYQQNSGAGADFNYSSNAVYRDASAWYHIVYSVDTTNATAANRVLLYVNGVLQTLTASTTATQNLNTFYNLASYTNDIGNQPSLSEYFDGYLTDINFIDGQALTPSSFGETDSITGVWKPKRYTGTYGTNGFFLNFSDPSAATAAAIGADRSGNGNNWTPNNISVTAGATYDSMLDVPTPWADGGNGRGNYCVLNPLTNQSSATISGANLNVSGTVAHSASTTFAYPTSGKWYCEIQITSTPENALNELVGITTDVGVANNVVRAYASNGQYFNGSSWVAFGAAWSANDVIGIAADIDNSQLSFYRNGTLQGSAQSFTFGSTAAPMVRMRSSGTSTFNANFGQRPFAYTPPTGFRALNTQNLPEPTIVRGNRFFDATTYTGNGSSQSVVNSGAMQPDLVWVKNRATTGDHILIDAVRGANQRLFSNLTLAESLSANSVSAFNANGFSVGADANVNGTGNGLIAWQWREGATQGFDIVTFSGNGSNQNISHSLGVAPRMMIAKRRDSTSNWAVYHASAGTGYLLLNSTAAYAGADPSIWNATAPTSSVFTVAGTAGSFFNSGTFVNYLFSEVAGFSRFGSYTGNGSTDGPFVFCGFRPRWVMVKWAGGVENWAMIDTTRSPSNAVITQLFANQSWADNTDANQAVDILSNGFKPRGSLDLFNRSGGTYIYAAFAEVPFKVALAR